VATALGASTIHVDDPGDDGTLAVWSARGRAGALLLRPQRVVTDTVPAGTGDVAGNAAGAAPLLPTARRPADARTVPLPRSTTS
jgi:3-(3-hydroxy-phenyl)propionate hydroxylase